MTAHLTDKERIHLRCSIIPFRQSCSLLLQELGTSMASGFSPSDLWRSSELAMYFCTHRSALEVTTLATHHWHFSVTYVCKMCDYVLCLSWLWIYCEIFCAEILWPELNILPCSVLQLTSAAESDICKESNAVVTMHFFPSGLRKTALQMLNSRPQCFLPVHSANILFTELHSFLDSITKGWKCVRMLQ